MAMALRPIVPEDQALLREIYADAIQSQAPLLYSDEQVRAWAALAWLPGVLDASFRDGSGWLTTDASAFAIRHPEDRLSLLYCRGCGSRRGHGRALVEQIEADALESGVRQLRTEASQFSRPLLERLGWCVEAPEMILIGGVPFERYRMLKLLRRFRLLLRSSRAPIVPAPTSILAQNGALGYARRRLQFALSLAF